MTKKETDKANAKKQIAVFNAYQTAFASPAGIKVLRDLVGTFVRPMSSGNPFESATRIGHREVIDYIKDAISRAQDVRLNERILKQIEEREDEDYA